MSNALASFNIPQLPANIAAQMLGNVNSSDESFGDGFSRLSFGGRTFHLKSGSSEIEWETRTIDVSLVASAPNDHRVFYKESYDAKATDITPTCWATDGVAPDASVVEKQSDKCETCPMNAKGSGANDSRACSRRRRVVFIVEEDSEKKLFTSDISASSIYAPRENKLGLFNWKDTIKQISTMVRAHPGLIPTNFLLQMSFTNDTVPIVQFSFKDQRPGGSAQAVRASSKETIDASVAAWNSGEAIRLIEAPVARGDGTLAPAPSAQAPQEMDNNIPQLGVSQPQVQAAVVQPQVQAAVVEESDDLLEL